MRLIRSPKALSTWSLALHREGIRIGLVPTMGALHAGHRALIRTARLTCDAVVVSLFVNPTQFSPAEDFLRYPRRLKADAALCAQEGIDVLFAPSVEAMYPTGSQTSVMVEGVSRRWEGEARPDHFAGVATVVTKLLNLVRPEVVFFGQKDFQQVAVVRRLVEDLHMGTVVKICPTVREPDGLALSSRNDYLSPGQRRAAPVLYEALRAGEAAIRRGACSADRVTRIMLARVSQEPLARAEYLAVCDPYTLEPLRRVTGHAVLLGSLRLGRIRLIDNLLVKRRGRGSRATKVRSAGPPVGPS
jgi:pantoate--beta-alanine ligase